MTEKEQIEITETERRNIYIQKRDVYRALLSVATSFIGALLALAVFAGLNKPPVAPGQYPPPCPPCERMNFDMHRGAPDMLPPLRGEFHGKPQKEFKGHRPDKGAMVPPPQEGMRPQFNKNIHPEEAKK